VGSCIVKNVLIYVKQDATLRSLFYLETALHVSGGTTTHHQEHKQLYLQYLLFGRLLLLPAAIVAVRSNGLTPVAQFVEAMHYMSEGRGVDSRWYHWNFSLTSSRPYFGPGIDSASNRNEYQEYFLVVKLAGAKG
jgi:hypothetical protein